MLDDDKWIFSSSGRYMFVSFAARECDESCINIGCGWDFGSYCSLMGFFAKIHYGKQNTLQSLNTDESYLSLCTHKSNYLYAFQLTATVLVKMTLDLEHAFYME